MLLFSWVQLEIFVRNDERVKCVKSVTTVLKQCVLYLWIRKVKLHIHSYSKVTRIYNVIGTLKGAIEPGNKSIYLAYIGQSNLMYDYYSGCRMN